MPENEEAWELWIECQTQWRTSGFGRVGLDYNTVYAEAERLEIDLSICTMKKIKALERYELSRGSEDAERGNQGNNESKQGAEG